MLQTKGQKTVRISRAFDITIGNNVALRADALLHYARSLITRAEVNEWSFIAHPNCCLTCDGSTRV